MDWSLAETVRSCGWGGMASTDNAVVDDLMSLGGKPARVFREAAREFWIQLQAFLYHAPPGRDAFPAFGFGFHRRMGGDPCKDARGERTTNTDVMIPGERGAEIVDSGDAAFPEAADLGIHFERRGNHHRARAPGLSQLDFHPAELGQSLRVG